MVISGLLGFQYHRIAQCHQTSSQPCCWTSTQNFYNILHTRLLFFFADIICSFADNFRNINDAINYLKIWATISLASGLFRITCLQVIIVALEHSVSRTYDVLEIGKIETNLGLSDLTELQNAFLAIFLLQLARNCLLSFFWYCQLKKSIMRQTNEIQVIYR